MLSPGYTAPIDIAAREDERLAALARYDVLDTPAEENFDRITRLVKQIFRVPMATLTLIDGHRQWFKSQEGLDVCETDRGPAFCSLTIRQTEALVVHDTLEDARFRNNPFVTGEPHVRFYAGAQLVTPDGHTIGTLCALDTKPRDFDDGQVSILKDLAAIVMSELELRLLSTTDGLTGALTRRAFREEGSRAITLALRHHHDLSCIMLDLDHFKSVNDGHGHAVGDLVITACVEVCRQELREADLIGRVGGEEFAILLPYTDRTTAMQVAEKIRNAIERVFVRSERGPVRISASLGVASTDLSVGDIDDLLKRADLALYAAKGNGRNCCELWQAPDPVPSLARRRVFKAGKIAFNGGHSVIDCTVRGLSDTGASLDVMNSTGLPDVFKLQISADQVSRLCRMTVRHEKQIEVEFE